MKHTVWDEKYAGRDELSQDSLLEEFDPRGSLDRRDLLKVLELVAKTSETPIGKFRPSDRFDEIFRPAPTRHLKDLFIGLRMALMTWDLDTDLEEALGNRCRELGLPMPKGPIMTLEEFITVWFGTQSKAA